MNKIIMLLLFTLPLAYLSKKLLLINSKSDAIRFRLIISKIITSIMLVLYSHILFAQQTPDWEISFNAPTDWSYLSEETGLLIIGSGEALQAVDPATKQVIWKMPAFRDAPLSSLQKMEKSPLLIFEGFNPKDVEGQESKLAQKKSNNGFFKTGDTKKRIIIIDPATGKIVFDSNVVEMKRISDELCLRDIGCYWFEGDNEEKKRVMGMVDLNDGKTLWIKEKPVQFKRISTRDILDPILDPEGNILFNYAYKTFRVNARTGETIWEKPFIDLKSKFYGHSKDRFYSFMGTVVTISLKTGEVIKGEIKSPDLVSLFGGPPEYYAKANLGKDSFVTSQQVLDGFFKSFPSTSGKGILISGFRSFNFFDDDMKPLWDKSPSLYPYYVTNVIEQPDGYLAQLEYTKSEDKSQKYAIANIDNSGKLIWKKEIANGKDLLLLTYTPYGVVYATSAEADILDSKTGQSRMVKKLLLKDGLNTIVRNAQQRNCYAFFQGNDLYELNFKTATYRKMLDKLEFKGDEVDLVPNTFEVRKDGYFLASDQNILFIDNEAIIRYRKYYKRPGMSVSTRRLIGGIAGFTAGLILPKEAQALSDVMYQTDNMTIDKRFNVAVADYYLGGIGSAGVTSDAVSDVFARTAKRIKIIQGARDHRLVLSNLEDGGNGFIKIDKDSGKELMTVKLNDKKPDIKIDDVIQGMYYFPDNKHLYFYSLADK